MRTLMHTLVLIISATLFAAEQTATPPAQKAAPAPAAEPTAIIHTTVGDLHCTLFPKIAPIGVHDPELRARSRIAIEDDELSIG